ncbi:hypothetical protein F5884DRAFT_892822 [Xylogone sp. PMI_703]|nr:hypothetical protein F5884DRAFT_892822 [Xylogone sp. PMI_703]
MSPRFADGIAKRACSRCSAHKRKCDKALPKCSLCMRLNQVCRYTTSYSSSSSSASSSTPLPEHFPSPNTLKFDSHKADIIQKLQGTEPKDIVAIYSSTLKPWFPIISESRLSSRLSDTWDNMSVDLILLSVTIVLLSTIPDHGDKDDLMSLYLSIKGWIGLAEGVGHSSLQIAQARLFTTLFETAHGLYPAAYISIAATARTLEVLVASEEQDFSSAKFTEEEKMEQRITWCGVLIVDRYVAAERGKGLPVTRGRVVPQLPNFELPYPFCSTLAASPFTPLQQCLRLFEASNLLDKVHTAIHEPTQYRSFNLEEVWLIVKTLNSLDSIIQQEIPDKLKIYSGSLAICSIGLILAYENGTKQQSTDAQMSNCRSIAITALNGLIEDICTMIRPFIEGEDVLDMKSIPPFITYLVYKAAALITHNMLNCDDQKRLLQRLKLLRAFLRLISKRWLVAERYTALLNEDTTPRILRAIEEC